MGQRRRYCTRDFSRLSPRLICTVSPTAAITSIDSQIYGSTSTRYVCKRVLSYHLKPPTILFAKLNTYAAHTDTERLLNERPFQY
jgi:hypothetical protein